MSTSPEKILTDLRCFVLSCDCWETGEWCCSRCGRPYQEGFYYTVRLIAKFHYFKPQVNTCEMCGRKFFALEKKYHCKRKECADNWVPF